jgi:hypothetical protein
MKRMISTVLSALLFWALAPAGGELLENALHYTLEGHAAHAAADGDRHDPPDPEHGCTDVIHLCSCCAGLSVLPTRAVTVVPTARSQEPVPSALFRTPVSTTGGIYRPPRA